MSQPIHIGVQLIAPNGLGSLAKGIRYYFAGRRKDGKVLLVWFAQHKKVWRTHCITMVAQEFEEAFIGEQKLLHICEKQRTVPEWLENEEGLNYDELDSLRKVKKQTYRQQVEKRLLKITPALENEYEILNAKDPLKAIAKYAYADDRDCIQHPHRLQNWFFAYILHGHDIWTLKQPTGQCGKWNRQSEKHAAKKFGRPSLDKGRKNGWPSFLMRLQIEKSYLARCGLGITMRRIHREAVREDFGCKTMNGDDGKLVIYHPENKPFPSYGQFRHVIVSIFGLKEVQTTIYGAYGLRNHASVELGNYTQQYANILENMEVDAYFVSERPKATNSDEPMPPLGVARAICVTTGACVGVGFSLGSETAEAYKSMLFSAVVPKSYVARLYGIPPEILNWNMQGLPPAFKSDRGPAGSHHFASDLEQRFPMKTMTPSYSGQSKPSVEGSHPRDINPEGPPTYLISDKTVIEMVKREVQRAASDNRSSDISSRLSDEMIHVFRQEGRVATPQHFWEVLSGRFRTSAHSMSIEQAVRAFWTPVTFNVDRHGVKYRHRYYSSNTFKEEGIHSALLKLSEGGIKGYVLNMVVRYIYVEVRGKLIELEATRFTRIDQEEFFIPLSELESTARELSILKSETRNSIEANLIDRDAKYDSITGKNWDGGIRKNGNPKRPTATTAHETIVVKRTGASRRKA